MSRRAQHASPSSSRSRREGGAALLVAMMMIAMMGMIGFASMNTVMRDRQVSGNASLSQHALYAADAGLSAAVEVLRIAPESGGCLAAPVPSATLPNGASYGPDATAPDPRICELSTAEEECEELQMSLGSGFRYKVWNIRTQGQAPGGAIARVHATAQRCHPYSVGS